MCYGNETKVFERRNGKVLHEFYCHCSGYITVKLSEEKNGIYCIECPNCKHQHFRVVKKGVITSDRANYASKHSLDKIKLGMSAYSKKSWEQKLAKRKATKQTNNEKQNDVVKHFLNELWKSRAGNS